MKRNTALWLLQIAKLPFDLDNTIDASDEKAIEYLLLNDLIENSAGELIIADRGQALIDYWLNTPLPTATWRVEL